MLLAMKTLDHKTTVLIVDDDPNILEVLNARLFSAGFQVLTATGAHQALDLLKAHPVNLLISDIRMPDMGGMELFEEVHSSHPDLPVIFLTAYGTIPDAVNAIKAGAVEYLTKPFDGQELLRIVREVLEVASSLRQEDVSPLGKGFAGGKTTSMEEIYDMAERVAPTTVNVLILGESGVGKEHLARLIHKRGPRRKKPFVVVDCGSTPLGLLESELFGHVRGAFTHAVRDKKGLIEAADHGSLFLDEIGNISKEMQVRLLRFLEDRKIRRIGDTREVSVDCRIIAATNADLAAEVDAGNFREDLFYRLRVIILRVPPLRERKSEIPLIAHGFVEAFCEDQGLPRVRVPKETVRWLCNYPWPGNVRELKNALEAGVVLCKYGELKPEDLRLSGLPEIADDRSQAHNPFSLEEGERRVILKALREAGWVQKDAASLLGISRRAIHYKIKKHGINVSDR
jgi:DNA-binding NtrC family response regulator